MNFGETVQVARGEYFCDRCCQGISAGERYRRWLWKVAPRRIHVMREHLECPPDESKEDVEKITNEYESQPLPLAA